MTNPKTIAVIPARGGSKRLPGKNTKLLGAYPLLVHSIKYAQNFQDIIDEIIVSTDSEEIADLAKTYGAKVIHRPAHLAGDLEPVITALQHVLDALDEVVENVVLLQPTNPLRPKVLLREAFSVFEAMKVSSLMTISKLEAKFGSITGNSFVPINYNMGQRSQDLPPLYRENGLLYICKAATIKKGLILTEDNHGFVTDSPFNDVDIDTENDFLFAETLLKKYEDQ